MRRGRNVRGGIRVWRAQRSVLGGRREVVSCWERTPWREKFLPAAQALYANVPLREGLRRLGRGAPQVLMRSTVGRVVLGSVEGPVPTIEAMARSYALHMRPSTLVVEKHGAYGVIIHLSDIHNFLDSHNVGVFEGVLRHAGVEGKVRVCSFSRTNADFLCEW